MNWNEYIGARAPKIFLEDANRQLCVDAFFARAQSQAADLAWLGAIVPGEVVPFAAPSTANPIGYLFTLLYGGSIALPLSPAFPAAYKAQIEHHLGIHNQHLPHRELQTDALDASAPATLVLTSGSSAAPKAVAHSLAQHLASAQAANQNIPLESGDRWLFTLPLFHVSGLAILFRCLDGGAAVVLPPPDAALLEQLSSRKITHCSMVAAQLYRCLADPYGPNILRGLKAILLGGSAIPPKLIERAVELELPIHTSYGLTETGSQIACTPAGGSLEDLATSGYPLGSDRVRINGAGVVEVGGPSLMLGYWKGGSLTQPFTEDGWLATNDLGQWDAQGRLSILGRADHMFVTSGENLQPEEVERALLKLEGVKEAIVVPVPHPVCGMVPAAIVQAADDLASQVEAWRAELAAILPKHAVPRHYLPWPMDHAHHSAIKVSRRKLALYAEAALHARL